MIPAAPASRTEPARFDTLEDLAQLLGSGHTTSRALVESALDRIADSNGQGSTVFLHVDAQAARLAADASDTLRRAGIVPSPLAGIPISIKDLFDVAGQRTRAGSTVLDDQPVAAVDAPVMARLKRAGAVLIGRTNMSEFAFSGLGFNPHYGTPLSPWARAAKHVAGGSSSGAAASVADRMAAAAIGTDTGGSVRIPAAFCGLTGFKPTARRIPRAGVIPLSRTLDSIGPIGVSVACCALLDRILAGMEPALPATRALAGARIGVVSNYVNERLEPAVAQAFGRALTLLSEAGARLVDVSLPALDQLPGISKVGNFSSIEAFAWHRTLLESRRAEYDQRVAARMLQGAGASAADYLYLIDMRKALIANAQPVFDAFDVLVCPTTPITPPLLEPLERDADTFTDTNMLVLRNPSAFNFLDACALSIPCQAAGEPPVGLMLCAAGGDDDRLLGIGMSIQHALATRLA